MFYYANAMASLQLVCDKNQVYFLYSDFCNMSNEYNQFSFHEHLVLFRSFIGEAETFLVT